MSSEFNFVDSVIFPYDIIYFESESSFYNSIFYRKYRLPDRKVCCIPSAKVLRTESRVKRTGRLQISVQYATVLLCSFFLITLSKKIRMHSESELFHFTLTIAMTKWTKDVPGDCQCLFTYITSSLQSAAKLISFFQMIFISANIQCHSKVKLRSTSFE